MNSSLLSARNLISISIAKDVENIEQQYLNDSEIKNFRQNERAKIISHSVLQLVEESVDHSPFHDDQLEIQWGSHNERLLAELRSNSTKSSNSNDFMFHIAS